MQRGTLLRLLNPSLPRTMLFVRNLRWKQHSCSGEQLKFHPHLFQYFPDWCTVCLRCRIRATGDTAVAKTGNTRCVPPPSDIDNYKQVKGTWIKTKIHLVFSVIIVIKHTNPFTVVRKQLYLRLVSWFIQNLRKWVYNDDLSLFKFKENVQVLLPKHCNCRICTFSNFPGHDGGCHERWCMMF